MKKYFLPVLLFATAVLSSTASASLSGTLLEAKDPWYQPYWGTVYCKYEPLLNSIAVEPSHVPIVMSGWWYGTYAYVGCAVRVKINGSTYVQATFLTSAGKLVIPNMGIDWNIPESAFNVGTNILEYELIVDPAYSNINKTTFYYKFSIVRT